MKKSVFLFLLCGLLSVLFAPETSSALASGQNVVTAAQVNGTWRTRSGTFKVWALGNQKLQVEFLGIYEYRTSAGMMANAGSGEGVAFIEGDTAIFKPEDADEECKITMKFTGGKLIVKQEGGCGFGHNVTAGGTYRKVSSRKPKFGES